MTVYVDNARIPATVGTHTSRWSHLTADTKSELHKFARRLGLHQSHFQTCKVTGRTCPAATCPHWHYDVTDRMRRLAISQGAVEIGPAKLRELIVSRLHVAARTAATMSTLEITSETAASTGKGMR